MGDAKRMILLRGHWVVIVKDLGSCFNCALPTRKVSVDYNAPLCCTKECNEFLDARLRRLARKQARTSGDKVDFK